VCDLLPPVNTVACGGLLSWSPGNTSTEDTLRLSRLREVHEACGLTGAMNGLLRRLERDGREGFSAFEPVRQLIKDNRGIWMMLKNEHDAAARAAEGAIAAGV